MNDPFHENDGVLKSLVEEASALPRAAAAQARARHRARTRTGGMATVIAVAMLGGGVWFVRHPPISATSNGVTGAARSTVVPVATEQGYVKVHQAGAVVEPIPVPPDASDRERRLLTELPGVPVLIVKNEAGAITRVHIFER